MAGRKERDMIRMNLILPVSTALLVFMGVTAQMDFAAENPNTVFAENKDIKEGMPFSGTKKILIVYFSYTGNTREIAGQIHRIVGGDVFEIQTVKPYPTEYNEVLGQAKRELDSGCKPALKTKVENMESYDLIFVGYPNWWGTFPAPVRTFLSEYDLSRKTIAPFCTHGGGGLGRSAGDISSLCPKSVLLDSFVIMGSDVKAARQRVSDWLRKIGITG
jgi:flavodoxin